MTPEQALKNGFWMSGASPGAVSDANIYKVAAGMYGFADATSPSDFTAANRGLALGCGVVPGAYAHDAAGGITSTFRTQDAFAASGGAGGDLSVQLGAGDGAGRAGQFQTTDGVNTSAMGSGFSTMTEQAAAPLTLVAGQGMLWVRNDVPNVLIFTDDTNTDTALGAGGGIGGAGTLNTVPKFTAATTLGDSTITDDGTGVVITQAAAAAGVPTALTLTGGAHTNATAGTELFDITLNLNRTVQHATGGITNQRAIDISTPTYSFVGASVITNAATVYINRDPVEGANCTITNSYSMWVDQGVSRLDDGLQMTERAAAPKTLSAGEGVLWVRNLSPSAVVFTDDTNVDHLLGTVTGTGSANIVPKWSAASALTDSTIGDDGTGVVITQAAAAAGVPTALTLTGGAHTNATASTELFDVTINLARTVQHATGGITNQRAIDISTPTYSFVGASVITNAATVYINRDPVEGANCTITNSYSMWVDQGVTRLDDGLQMTEQAAAPKTLVAGEGVIWVRNDAPNVLVFTDDTNTDTVLGAGGGSPGGPLNAVQFNQPAGTFDGDAEFTWTTGTATAAIIGIINAAPSGAGANTKVYGSAVAVTGADNTIVGTTGTTLTTGTSNVVIGNAADVPFVGNASVVVVGANSQAGERGVAIGESASPIVTSSDNVVVGQGAATLLVAGAQNVIVGQGAAIALAANGNAVVMGHDAAVLMTGADNTVVGQLAGATLVGGASNVVIGRSADVAVAGTNTAVAIGDSCQAASTGVTVGQGAATGVTGADNTVVGALAAVTLTSGSSNVIVGKSADVSGTGTADAVAIGDTCQAAVQGVTVGSGAAPIVTGTDNTVVGQGAALLLTSAINDVIIGTSAAPLHTTGQGKLVIIGAAAGGTITTGNNCVIIGADADCANATESSAVIIGAQAQGASNGIAIGRGCTANVTASNNLALGFNAAPTLTTGTRNILIGHGGIDVAVLGTSDATLVGYQAQVAEEGVAIGAFACQSVTGTGNVAIGYFAAQTLVAGINDIVIGDNADVAAAGTNDAVAIGDNCQAAVNGVTIGSGAAPIVTGTDNVVVGQGAGGTITSGNNCVIIGAGADCANAAETSAVIIGAQAQGASNGIAIGRGCSANVTASNNLVMGFNAAPTLTTGTRNVLIGHGGIDVAVLGTSDAVLVGYQADVAENGVAIGGNASASVTGLDNIAIGYLSAPTLVAGTSNIVIGANADVAAAATADAVVIGDTAQAAVNGVTIGSAAAPLVTGTDNVVVGQGAATLLTSSVSNVIVGTNAADTLATGTGQNVIIGDTANTGTATQDVVVIGDAAASTFNTCVVIGSGAASTAANQFIVSTVSAGYFGNGVTNAAPQNFTLNATGGVGNNINGANLRLQSGLGTGTTGVSGSLELYTSDFSGALGVAHAAQWCGSAIPDEGTITGLAAGEASRGFTFRRAVELQTSSPYTVAIADSGKVFHTTATQTFNLPAASPGLMFTFVVNSTNTATIAPNGTDTIQVAGSTSTVTTGAITANVIGNVITLVAILDASQAAPEWFAVGVVGTWTVT